MDSVMWSMRNVDPLNRCVLTGHDAPVADADGWRACLQCGTELRLVVPNGPA